MKKLTKLTPLSLTRQEQLQRKSGYSSIHRESTIHSFNLTNFFLDNPYSGKAVLGERKEFLDRADPDSPKLLQNLPSQIGNHNIALWLAACAEMNSEHPLAKAVVNSAKQEFGGDFTFSREGVAVSDSIIIPGEGVEATVYKQGWGRWNVRVGKRSFVNSYVSDNDKNSSLNPKER